MIFKRKFQILYSEIKFRLKKLIGNDEKIFIIGRNKTGTTSIEKCLKSLGYKVGNQVKGELFIDDYQSNNFDNILNFCDSAEVFQDAPFSWPNTYKYLYKKYPKAKYILLERESSDIWYQSVINFQRKIVNQGDVVSADDLKAFYYRKKGFLWQSQQFVFGIDETTLYDKDIYIENYEKHNKDVKDFFLNKGYFLSIKLTDQDVIERLAKFLDFAPEQIKIPHLNKSK